ncbi:hypothetical protein CLU79DRAFT_731180 [Phycomyces nitens]|nr:hypothetical protein CLU79DRAFT_731180 [Phycomyces nitens]
MARQQTKRAPKPKAVKKPKEPETFEEIMEAGVEAEEQGERYSTGDRAQRKYEVAAEYYSKAHLLNPTDADCLYNWGRVQFLLVGLMPPYAQPEKKLAKIDESIKTFRKALELEQNKSDAQFNLAQALHQRAETLNETTEIDNAYSQSAMALQEAISLFESVYELQEKEYKESRLMANKPVETPEEHTEEHVHTSECKHDHDHDHQHQHENEHKNEHSETKDSKEDMTSVTQVEATTTTSLIDTLISTSETMASMASMLASFQASTDLFSRARSKLSLAEKWLSDIPESEKEYKSNRIQINLKEAQCFSAMADRAFLASGKPDHALFSRAIERLDEIVEQFDPSNVQAMCDRGDILTSFAQALVDSAERTKTKLVPETTGKEVWQLYAQATKSFQAGLAIEQKNLSILNKLGDLCMSRASLELPVAERNKGQLLKNAEFYYKQAVQTDKLALTSGWVGWVFSLWAQEEWLGTKGKKQEATKMMKMWINYGGNHAMFQNGADESEVLDPGFVEWVNETFFEEESEEESD